MVTFDQTGGFKGRFMPFLVRHTYRRAEGIIAVSQGVAEDIVRFTGISKERVHTLYNPVVTPEIGERAREPVDHPWFKPGAPPVILGAGSLSVQKDFDTLVRAFALLRQSQEAKLIILGEGKRRRELEKVIHQLNLGADVELPGFVPNPFAYMGKAALFVLSSRWEGLPGVLIQAMACGCPVVSTDCPSGPREILDAGRYGSLIEVGDVPGLAHAMQEALTTPLSGEILQRRARQFSASEVIPKYINVLFAHKALSQRDYA
jgi:glycosyltransferase involved in cell wall biosynthesis